MKAKIIKTISDDTVSIYFLNDKDNYCGSISNIKNWSIKRSIKGSTKSTEVELIIKEGKVLFSFDLEEEPEKDESNKVALTKAVTD